MSTPIKIIFSLCLCLGVALSGGSIAFADKTVVSGPAKFLKLPEVVARVNGVDIKSNHVNFEFNRVVRENPNPLDAKQQKELAKNIIDSEVTRELVYQKAKSDGVKVESKGVEDAFGLIRKNFKSEDDWKKALRARGIKEATLKHSIEMDLIARKFLESKVKGKVKITDAQVKNFYDENIERFKRPESFKSQHIFIPYVSAEKQMEFSKAKISKEELSAQANKLRAQARKEIDKIDKELKDGGDFAELAKKYSQDAGSAEKGGDLGFVYKGMLDKEYDAAVSKLKPDGISGVVESRYGFHLIKLNETLPAGQAKFEEVKASVQQHLFTEEAKKLVSRNIDLFRKEAKIEMLYKP